MNYLPNIPIHTVANYTFQNTLVDASGRQAPAAVDAGTEQYDTFTGGFVGFRCDNGTGGHNPQNSLLLPNVAAFRFTGEFTIECAVKAWSTPVQTMFSCEDPTGTSDIYSTFVDPSAAIGYRDQFQTYAFPNNCAPTISWPAGVVQPAIFIYMLRRRRVSSGAFKVDMAINGATPSVGAGTTSTQVLLGTEQLRIGGWSGTHSDFQGSIGSFRVLDYPIPDSLWVNDYNYVINGIPYPTTGVNFDPDDRRDSLLLRGKAGLSMQTGFKERMPNDSTTIAAFRNMTAAAQAANIYRQNPKMFPMPDDGRST